MFLNAIMIVFWDITSKQIVVDYAIGKIIIIDTRSFTYDQILNFSRHYPTVKPNEGLFLLWVKIIHKIIPFQSGIDSELFMLLFCSKHGNVKMAMFGWAVTFPKHIGRKILFYDK